MNNLFLDNSIYEFNNLSSQAECDTKSIFKQSLTGLNLKVSFS